MSELPLHDTVARPLKLHGVSGPPGHILAIAQEPLVDPLRKALAGAEPGATHILTFRTREGWRPALGDVVEYGGIPVEVLGIYDPYAEPAVDPRSIEDRTLRADRSAHDQRIKGRWTKLLVRAAPGGEPEPAEPTAPPRGPSAGRARRRTLEHV
jgi:hypothetical protein